MPHADIRHNHRVVIILQIDSLATIGGGFSLTIVDRRLSTPLIEHFDSFDHARWRWDELTVGMKTVPVV